MEGTGYDSDNCSAIYNFGTFPFCRHSQLACWDHDSRDEDEDDYASDTSLLGEVCSTTAFPTSPLLALDDSLDISPSEVRLAGN